MNNNTVTSIVLLLFWLSFFVSAWLSTFGLLEWPVVLSWLVLSCIASVTV